MQFSKRTTILVNCCSFFGVAALIVKRELNQMVLLLAVGLLVLNLYNILSELIKQDSERDSRRSGFFDYSPINMLKESKNEKLNIQAFEQKVRHGAMENKKKSGCVVEENKYWSDNYLRKNEKIEELKSLQLNDLAKDRVERREQEYTMEFSTIKKIRNYVDSMEDSESNMNIKEIQTFIEGLKSFKNSDGKGVTVPEKRIKQCLAMLDQHIEMSISSDYDSIVTDFNAADRFLHRCFSVSLTLRPSYGSSTVSYKELLEMMRLIDQKGVLPGNFTSNFSTHQVCKELQNARRHIERLPSFNLPPNILKLEMFMKYLRREFPNEYIILSSIQRNDGRGKSHIFKFTENNKIYYNNASDIKSMKISTSVLLFCLSIHDSSKRKEKGLLREILSFLQS